MSGRLRATTSAERDDMTDNRKPDDTDAPITEDRTIDHRGADDDGLTPISHAHARENCANDSISGRQDSTVNSGDIDDELDPWLAEHAGDDYTNNECPRCGAELLNQRDKPVVDEHGDKHEHITDAPNPAACYCLDCWIERRSIERKRENVTLTDFGVKIDNRTLDEFDGKQGGAGG